MRTTGVTQCAGGVESDTCRPAPGAADDRECDGFDADCDGRVDEDYLGDVVECGVGACVRQVRQTCVDGQIQNSCQAGEPSQNDATCDGVDDDYDTRVDEGVQVVVTECGRGACLRQASVSAWTGCVGACVYPVNLGMPIRPVMASMMIVMGASMKTLPPDPFNAVMVRVEILVLWNASTERSPKYASPVSHPKMTRSAMVWTTIATTGSMKMCSRRRLGAAWESVSGMVSFDVWAACFGPCVLRARVREAMMGAMGATMIVMVVSMKGLLGKSPNAGWRVFRAKPASV